MQKHQHQGDNNAVIHLSQLALWRCQGTSYRTTATTASTATVIATPSDLTRSAHTQHPHLSKQATSSPSSISTERQNTLLSLLGNVALPLSESATLNSQQRVMPPTTQMSLSESQSRYLLDQLLPYVLPLTPSQMTDGFADAPYF